MNNCKHPHIKDDNNYITCLICNIYLFGITLINQTVYTTWTVNENFHRYHNANSSIFGEAITEKHHE